MESGCGRCIPRESTSGGCMHRSIGTATANVIAMAAVTAALAAGAGCDGATARLSLANQTVTSHPESAGLLANGTSLRLKMVAVYLAEDVDPNTMNNVGSTEMIWL